MIYLVLWDEIFVWKITQKKRATGSVPVALLCVCCQFTQQS